MDVMEPEFPSSAVEIGRYDCMVAANSARKNITSHKSIRKHKQQQLGKNCLYCRSSFHSAQSATFM
ncbi:hypothetical protein KIN20_019211 [Parelaphostrongylus tenuis]|uniref:Uncharacterized protein n=1 Tax=Parelaphostrongylus tenuis TaxID=148309 RepID=A0AAD5QUX5_PARTN|nr:hypothetical protein KIN20_019211 [Parelaphostrongylus tenuis]